MSSSGRPPDSPQHKSAALLDRFTRLNKKLLKNGAKLDQLRETVKSVREGVEREEVPRRRRWLSLSALAVALLCLSATNPLLCVDQMVKSALSVKCVVPNNYVVWEATRPVTDCSMCSNLSQVIVLANLSRAEFQPFAYSYRPMLLKGAALNWPAMKVFDYAFFKRLYETTPGAYESVEEDCQFLNFKSNFSNLKEVFSMPKERAKLRGQTEPWYIGWSNCHTEILKEMRKYYEKPHFLPEDAEHSHIDFVFMGYQQGAFMHLDYISRLMWQAQLRGHKVWRLIPPPECESICSNINFTVSPGDILLLDTRQWYHDTHILDGKFSITVSSEYG